MGRPRLYATSVERKAAWRRRHGMAVRPHYPSAAAKQAAYRRGSAGRAGPGGPGGCGHPAGAPDTRASGSVLGDVRLIDDRSRDSDMPRQAQARRTPGLSAARARFLWGRSGPSRRGPHGGRAARPAGAAPRSPSRGPCRARAAGRGRGCGSCPSPSRPLPAVSSDQPTRRVGRLGPWSTRPRHAGASAWRPRSPAQAGTTACVTSARPVCGSASDASPWRTLVACVATAAAVLLRWLLDPVLEETLPLVTL